MTLIKYGAIGNLVHPEEGFVRSIPSRCGNQSMQNIPNHAALAIEHDPCIVSSVNSPNVVSKPISQMSKLGPKDVK